MNTADYPPIPVGATRTNLTPFQVRTLPSLPCGASVEVELQVSIADEGTFAMLYTLPGGTNCATSGGGCESCRVVSGVFDSNSPSTLRILNTVNYPSICLPQKPCPGSIDLLVPVRYAVHAFTNVTEANLCLTAQLHHDCTNAPSGSLASAAYLDSFQADDPCANHLGDPGAPLLSGGYLPFSFNVPSGERFELMVAQLIEHPGCNGYRIEVFGLPCPPPMLHISRDSAPGKVQLTWSTAYPDWQLQSVGDLAEPMPLFLDVTNPPGVVVGRYTLTNTAASNQFYRLYRP
jgi:hypothetical protein